MRLTNDFLKAFEKTNKIRLEYYDHIILEYYDLDITNDMDITIV